MKSSLCETRTLYKQWFSFFICSIWVVCVLTGCEKKASPELREIAIQGETMGTFYHIKMVGEDGTLPDAMTLKTWSDDELQKVNATMSTYIDTSELSQLNTVGSVHPIRVSQPLFEVLLISRQISELTEGAFDVTVSPLVELWGFGVSETDRKHVPSEDNIAQAKSRIGFHKVALNGELGTVAKPKDMTIDLSAIAKGYGVDRVAEMLIGRGYVNHMVEVGGELRLSGVSVRGTPWRIGVETPSYSLMAPTAGPAKTVELSDVGMATSGDYRNYYEVDGKRYSHTIDPMTGKPIAHALASVTVIADTCAEADGLATGFNVMGAEKALKAANEHDIAAFFIVKTADGFETRQSKAFDKFTR